MGGVGGRQVERRFGYGGTEVIERGTRYDVGQIKVAERLPVSGHDHERDSVGQSGCRRQGFRAEGKCDRVDLAAAIGLEDLVQGADRDLVDRPGVPVLPGLERQQRRGDLVLRPDVLIFLDGGNVGRRRDGDCQSQLAVR